MYAIIDVGSNTVRMNIYKQDRAGTTFPGDGEEGSRRAGVIREKWADAS